MQADVSLYISRYFYANVSSVDVMNKSLTIDNSLLVDMFFENSELWGISTSLQGYDLCHVLNVSLRLQLVRRVDLDVRVRLENKQKGKPLLPDLFSEIAPVMEELSFPVYYQELPFCETVVSVFGNKYEGKHLIPNIKNADYLILIHSANYFTHLLKLDQYLNQVRKIDAVQKIPLESLKGKDYLII